MPYPQNTVILPVTQIYGSFINSKMRAINVTQAQNATLQFPLIDPVTYAAVDLTPYNLVSSSTSGPTFHANNPLVNWVNVRFMEAIGLAGIAADADPTTIVNAGQGIISCPIPGNITANAGVYLCEAGVFDANSNLLFSNTAYLFVERGLYTAALTNNPQMSGTVGPPTLQELRINLRDQPELNRLIDVFEFDIADICEATVRAVTYWNNVPPPIRYVYDTTSYPYRYQLMDGIAVHLFELAANYYRRNQLKYQAGGVAVDDLGKEQEYERAAQMRREKWEQWVKMTKVSLNIGDGFSTLGSGYGYTPGYYGVDTW